MAALPYVEVVQRILSLVADYPAVLQPDELNLLEDGLQLWLIALRNAPAPHASLLDLFPTLAAVMERSTGATSH